MILYIIIYDIINYNMADENAKMAQQLASMQTRVSDGIQKLLFNLNATIALNHARSELVKLHEQAVAELGAQECIHVDRSESTDDILLQYKNIKSDLEHAQSKNITNPNISELYTSLNGIFASIDPYII